jgi:hypothetical protein
MPVAWAEIFFGAFEISLKAGRAKGDLGKILIRQ